MLAYVGCRFEGPGLILVVPSVPVGRYVCHALTALLAGTTACHACDWQASLE